jgi:hypothetical protein
VQDYQVQRLHKRIKLDNATHAPSALGQANFTRRSIREQQTALSLAQFSHANSDLNLSSDRVENLVGALIVSFVTSLLHTSSCRSMTSSCVSSEPKRSTDTPCSHRPKLPRKSLIPSLLPRDSSPLPRTGSRSPSPALRTLSAASRYRLSTDRSLRCFKSSSSASCKEQSLEACLLVSTTRLMVSIWTVCTACITVYRPIRNSRPEEHHDARSLHSSRH